jgi:hypothetical protein
MYSSSALFCYYESATSIVPGLSVKEKNMNGLVHPLIPSTGDNINICSRDIISRKPTRHATETEINPKKILQDQEMFKIPASTRAERYRDVAAMGAWVDSSMTLDQSVESGRTGIISDEVMNEWTSTTQNCRQNQELATKKSDAIPYMLSRYLKEDSDIASRLMLQSKAV